MLQAEQEAADLDMKVQAFKRLDEEATTSGAAEQIDSTSIDGGSGPQVGAPKYVYLQHLVLIEPGCCH